ARHGRRRRAGRARAAGGARVQPPGQLHGPARVRGRTARGERRDARVPVRPRRVGAAAMTAAFFSKERLVARPDTSRWWVAPAALAIHLSIGQAYAFSVFNKPLAEEGGWKLTELGWIFTCAIGFLGLSAAVFGQWLERVGPRVSGVVAAACFGSGLWLAALGVSLKLLPLIIFGYGVLGGIGLGLGYITPVSTLIKWFPDRRGMATGIAIMGFGGGAIIAAPLSRALMKLLHGV